MYLLAEVNVAPDGSGAKAGLSIDRPGGIEQAICKAILVPFPRRVMMDAVEVQGQAEEWVFQAKTNNWIEDRDVVFRTLLVRSNIFKQTLLERQDRGSSSVGYPRDFVKVARSLPMPRYVWLIEISYLDEWDPGDPASPPVVADIILDSTSTETMRPEYLLLHLPGITIGQPVVEANTEVDFTIIQQDYPHPPFPDIPRP
jgi:hypothetical protein